MKVKSVTWESIDEIESIGHKSERKEGLEEIKNSAKSIKNGVNKEIKLKIEGIEGKRWKQSDMNGERRGEAYGKQYKKYS